MAGADALEQQTWR